MLERLFDLKGNGTTLGREVVGGATTFLAMAYIIFVNPDILSATGMDRDAVFVATCLASAGATLLMGLYANYPIALAPGMGLNAFFAFTIVGTMGVPWQAALGAVFLSGVLFCIVSVLPVRRWIIDAIPSSQKLAIGAGIGLLLAIIALQNAGIVVSHPATMVGLGDLGQPSVLLACAGFVVIVALDVRKVPGAIIIGVLGVTVVSVALGLSAFSGIVAMPPSIAPTLFELDLAGVFDVGLVSVVFTLFLVTLFDNTGTAIAVARQGGFIGEDGQIPRVGRVLAVDSTASMIGALFGTSTTTSYVESAAGIRAGGRSGLTAVVVALLFLLALFLAPLAGTVPGFATAPAILFVGCVMARSLADLDWDDLTEYVPAVITAIGMPLTFSISTGLGLGFISYAVIKLLSGRLREVGPAMWVLAALFVLEFALKQGTTA